ncbi:nitrile hydratase subunit beta [Pseudomonas typographi]|uniref:Nitrile hydratase subunit beta n=1 Tax=Pseudomonas typographi TaxID=2715964 RepID=A0ABR7Z007_9PSED|nr:nitrile hydratase subunit beta [Pseudomonas typographi]MBD1550552.1 nitrile hydratase subunit beta [Pseudomonas typographi]MBD1586861.1 nitrile hydratase subunit beta [Pseudomonas typographi]MBD1598757.1 nitrile hydratase subunit beta [Pseudomonas typographi]
MNSIHDVGGLHGMGRIVIEADEPPFHEPWEGRMHGIAVSCQISGVNFTAEQRSTIEQMGYIAYLSTSYYEKWLYAYETLLADKGIISKADIDRRVAEQAQALMPAHPQEPPRLSEYGQKLKAVLYQGTPHDRPLARQPKFKVGDLVHTLNRNALRHSRLPRFARDKDGVIEAYHGAHCHPEPHAAGIGDVPEHLYCVRFDGETLWGPDAEAGASCVYVDLFEDYLAARAT